MRTVLQTATVAIVEVRNEFYVYAGDTSGAGHTPLKLIRVCPSEGMAREIAAGY